MGSPSSAKPTNQNDCMSRPGARSDRAGHSAFWVLFAGIAGGVWGLGLARALAEHNAFSPTFDLAPSLGLALFFALVAGIACWWLAARIKAHGIGLAALPLFLAGGYVLWPEFAPHVGWALLVGSLVLSGLLALRIIWLSSSTKQNRGYSWLVAACLGLVVIALYLLTLGPTVGQADTFEFQVVAPTLGVAHPTGYPLYVLSGKIFSLIPFGQVAWRVNLSSAVFGTLAVVCVYLIVLLLTEMVLVAFLASVAFAFSGVFWSQAVVAEVYTLHNLVVGVILLVLVEALSRGLPNSGKLDAAQEDRGRAGDRGRGLWDRSSIYVLAFLFGLGLANHLTTVLLLPAAALTLILVRPRLSWREWVIALAAFLLPLSLYLYVYLRWPALNEGVWMSLSEFWRYVTGQQFGGALRLDAWLTDPTRYDIVARLLREPFGWPGLILSACGLTWLAIKRWRVALVSLAAWVPFVWYALSYYVPDVSVFLLPAHLVLAVWLGAGMAAIVDLGHSIVQSLRRPPAPEGLESDVQWTGRGPAYVVPITLFALLPLSLLWVNYQRVDQSNAHDDYIWGERILDLPVHPDAAILADSARIAPLYYLQRIEDRRPDLDLLVLADEAIYRAELESRLADGQSVYLARYLPGLEGLYHLGSLGPLTQVATVPLVEQPSYDRSINARFGLPAEPGGYIELLGLTGPTVGPEGGVGFTLFWRTSAPVDEVFHVRMRLVDDNGSVWWQDGGHHAVNNYYPTLAWRPGELVTDYHEIPLLEVDSGATPDRLTLQVGWFYPFTETGLAEEAGETWYPVAQLSPVPALDRPTPNRSLHIQFPKPRDSDPGTDNTLVLVGAELPETVPAGSEVELVLFFSHSGAGSGTLTALGLPDSLSMTWVDGHGRPLAATILENWGPLRFLLQAPGLPGDYDLRLGMLDHQGQGIPIRCGWLGRSTKDCALGALHVTESTDQSLANFGGELLLRSGAFGSQDAPVGSIAPLSPGQSVQLTLDWMALKSMEEDYTVSVQLVGPDGRLYGQTDSWPVQGTFPTGQWQPRQSVVDSYHVALSPDAPPGAYRVGVVVYLLKTQQRLPVLDDAGVAIGDMVWVGDFEVLSNAP
jgi:hypothetical protein